MKLKTLLIVVALLAALSAAVYVTNRPEAPAAADARVGQPLVDSATIEKAAQVTVAEGGNTVKLVKAGDNRWVVESYHGLPADFTKLSRLISELRDAKVDSFVTSNPERLSRLDFKDTAITLADAQGAVLWSLTLGKTADGGGRFAKFGDENKAYRTRLNAWLDPTPRNWADAALLQLKAEQVARVEITFPDASTLVATRVKAEDAFALENASEGQTLRRASLDSLLSSLTGLRFTDTAPADSDEAQAARAHQRQVKLTTFDGATVTVTLGRKPEETIVKSAEIDPETSGPAAVLGSATDPIKPEESGPAAVTAGKTETIPAGPVFAFIEGPENLARLTQAAPNLAFKVSDYVFTSLPKAPADLIEAPAPAAASENVSASESAAEADPDSPPAP